MAAVKPRVRTRELPDVRRNQLLDAARELVLEHGTRATTMADVAERAGVAKGTTYLYFGSKDELIAALRADYLTDFAAALRADPGASPSERLDRYVEGMFRFAADHHTLHHALVHHAGTSESDAMIGALELLEPIVAAGVADASFTIGPDDAATAATFLLHGIHGAVVTTLHRHDHGHDQSGVGRAVGAAELDRAVAETIALTRRSVGAPQP